MKKLIRLILLLLVIGCGKNQTTTEVHFSDKGFIELPDGKGNNGKPIICHLTSEPDNLHPVKGLNNSKLEVFIYTQQRLINFNQKTGFTSTLLESVPTADNEGKSYTFTLKDLYWDNGEKVSSSDFLFTAKAFLYAQNTVSVFWEGVSDIKLIDEKTFTILFKSGKTDNLNFLIFFPLLQRSFYDNENVLSKYDLIPDTNILQNQNEELRKWLDEFLNYDLGRNPAMLNGLGNYRLEKWVNGNYLQLVKKEKDCSGNILASDLPEKIIFKINKDDNSTYLQFKNLEMDLSANISMNNFLQMSSDKVIRDNYNLTLLPSFNYTYLAMNEKPSDNRQKLFVQKEVRKAIASAVNVDELTKLVYRNYSKYCLRQTSIVSPLKQEYNKELKPIEFNLQKASENLTSAGWKDSDKDGVLDKMIDNKKVSFSAELLYLNTNSEWKILANAISATLSKIGVKIIPVASDIPLFTEKARSHDFDMLLGTWSTAALPEDFASLWHSDSWIKNGFNYSGFGSPQSDSLIEAINQSSEEEKRILLTKQLQELVYLDQPFVFLYSPLKRYIINKRFKNTTILTERPGIIIENLK